MTVKLPISFKRLAALLSIAILLVSLPFSAVAIKNVDVSRTERCEDDQIVIDPVLPDDEIESELLSDALSKKPGDKTLSELQKMEVDTLSLPEMIDSETAIRKGHVNRIAQQESSLNSIAFQNKDGTKTAYLFSSPVKYFDSEGNVKDKRTTIQPSNKTGYAYAMEDNSVKVFFPENVGSGVALEYGGYFLSMVPETSTSGAMAFSSKDNTIEYSEVYEPGVLLQYKPTLNGFKEDIVLSHIPERNIFDFELFTTGLIPKKINEKWYLINLTEKVIGEFQTIRINDSAGKTVIGSMEITTDGPDGTYRVHVTVPLQFLEAEDTVYPVYVDPSVTILETGGYYEYYNDGSYAYFPYNSIIDTGLYSSPLGVSFAQGETDIHIVGYDEYIYGNGKVIYKLYDFYGDHGQYTQLTDSQIGQVSLRIKAEPWGNSTINANPMTSTWNTNFYGDNPIALCDSTLWSSYSTNHSSSKYISSTGEYSIDIKEIVKGWARYNSGTSVNNYDNPSYGFVLSNSSTSTCCDITAVEEFYADSVSVVLDYSDYVGDYYINNSLFGCFLKNGISSTLTTSTYTSGNRLKWKFEYLGNYKYYIRSLNNSNYALHKLSEGVNLALLPSLPDDDYIWDIRVATGGGVIIKNKGSGTVLSFDGNSLKLVSPVASNSPNYKQTVWRVVTDSNYVNLSSFSASFPEWMSIGSSQNSQLSFYPTNSTWTSYTDFEWKSADPAVATVSNTGQVTAVSSGYTNIIVTHKPTGLYNTVQIVVGTMLNTSKYYHIKNIYSGKYAELESVSYQDGVNIEQYSYHDSDFAKWKFIYSSNGYYYIQSKYSGLYIGISGNSIASGAAIIQTSTQSNATKWRVLVTSDGNYKFVSYLSGLTIALPSLSTDDGINLQQLSYSNDTNFNDEWLIEEKSDVSLVAIPERYDRTSFFSDTVLNLASIGYDSNVFSKQLCMNHNFLVNRIANSKITVVHTHGNQESIQTSHGDVNVALMSSLPTGTLSYSELVIFGACETGKGGSYQTNLVNATYSAGAQTVIGFEDSVWNTEVNDWCFAFFEEIANGETISSACYAADLYIETYWYDPTNPEVEIGTDSWYIAGNPNAILSN